jgi:hypothetical protein
VFAIAESTSPGSGNSVLVRVINASVKIREFSGSERKITPVYTPIAAVWAVFKGICGFGTGQRVGIME